MQTRSYSPANNFNSHLHDHAGGDHAGGGSLDDDSTGLALVNDRVLHYDWIFEGSLRLRFLKLELRQCQSLGCFAFECSDIPRSERAWSGGGECAMMF